MDKRLYLSTWKQGKETSAYSLSYVQDVNTSDSSLYSSGATVPSVCSHMIILADLNGPIITWL